MPSQPNTGDGIGSFLAYGGNACSSRECVCRVRPDAMNDGRCIHKVHPSSMYGSKMYLLPSSSKSLGTSLMHLNFYLFDRRNANRRLFSYHISILLQWHFKAYLANIRASFGNV